MIRVLVDTNVVIDFLAQREPFYDAARRLMVFASMGDYELWLSASQVSDVFYILSSGGKGNRMAAARGALAGLMRVLHVCAPGQTEVFRAIESGWDDFEDALVYQAAVSIGAEVIVTRDATGYAPGLLPALDCEAFFPWMERTCHLSYEELEF